MRRPLFLAGLVLCIGTAALSVWQLWQLHTQKEASAQQFEALQLQVATEAPTEAENEEPQPFTKYDALAAQNPDMIGWLRIDDIGIDYPVMQTPEEPEYYLNHTFDKTTDIHGVLFAEGSCHPGEPGNVTIFGHSMRDGSMFAQLHEFANPKYCGNVPDIVFDTLTEPGLWKPVCVFKISTAKTQDFPYHLVNRFSDTSTASEYLSRARYYALWYDDTVPIPEDAQLLSLSTCEYSLDNGRLVLVAVRIFPDDRP